MNEIEEKFFKKFEIKPYKSCIECRERDIGCLKGEITRKNCNSKSAYIYPLITDRILLELICIVFHTFYKFDIDKDFTVETLKERILRILVIAKDDVYNEVQALFESEVEDGKIN